MYVRVHMACRRLHPVASSGPPTFLMLFNRPSLCFAKSKERSHLLVICCEHLAKSELFASTSEVNHSMLRFIESGIAHAPTGISSSGDFAYDVMPSCLALPV